MKTEPQTAWPDVDFFSSRRSPDDEPLIAARKAQRAVIIGYQQSQAAARALSWAATEAATLDVPLYVARAWRWDEDFAKAGLSPERAALVQTARTTLPLATISGSRLILCDGDAATDLEHLAPYGQMMVVGRRRIPVGERLFNGSVSRHLVAAAEHPVVVVPDSHSPVRDRGPIVVAVSASHVASSAVRWAALRAARQNEELILIHAELATPRSHAEHSKAAHGSSESSTAMLERAASLAREVGGSTLRISREARSTTAESAILDACENSSLLVLGKHRVSWPGHRVGFIADYVLRHAELPIAVIPENAVDPQH